MITIEFTQEQVNELLLWINEGLGQRSEYSESFVTAIDILENSSSTINADWTDEDEDEEDEDDEDEDEDEE